ncbi:MAG: hypothetical protein ACRCWO_05970 [Bosea sp. (in: a-proteobacteria)]
MTANAFPLAPGKSCGSCTLCCKLFPVPELEKPAGTWCRHIAQGRGCGIHETRPPVCRAFDCQWLFNAELGPEWKPERCKFVLSIYPGSNSLVVTADPGAPRAWAQEPFITSLRLWAQAALDQGDCVLVFERDKASAILPDGEKPLGVILPGDRIISTRKGAGYDVEVRR